MALAKVTIEALTQMANLLRQSVDDILLTKEQMDSELYSIPWDDPIGLAFIGRYEEDFKPLKEKLIPAIEDYVQYMIKEGAIVSEYNGGSTGGLDVGGAVGVGAMGVGIGIAGTARINSNPKKSDVFSEPLNLSAKGSPASTPPVFETDQSSIRVAAAEILEEMTEKDLFIDSKEVQNQLSDKSDEIFKNKYNTSLNELGLNSGFNPETNGYYEDHNKISEELRNEVAKMKDKFEPTPIRQMDNDAVYAELSPEQKTTYDKLKKEILERKENAEFHKKIAKKNAFWDADFDTPQNVRNRDYSQIYEADKEIKKAEEDLEKLAKGAREALRNYRNQKIKDYISNSRK